LLFFVVDFLLLPRLPHQRLTAAVAEMARWSERACELVAQTQEAGRTLPTLVWDGSVYLRGEGGEARSRQHTLFTPRKRTETMFLYEPDSGEASGVVVSVSDPKAPVDDPGAHYAIPLEQTESIYDTVEMVLPPTRQPKKYPPQYHLATDVAQPPNTMLAMNPHYLPLTIDEVQIDESKF
jgi:hypothetical protein